MTCLRFYTRAGGRSRPNKDIAVFQKDRGAWV